MKTRLLTSKHRTILFKNITEGNFFVLDGDLQKEDTEIHYKLEYPVMLAHQVTVKFNALWLAQKATRTRPLNYISFAHIHETQPCIIVEPVGNCIDFIYSPLDFMNVPD